MGELNKVILAIALLMVSVGIAFVVFQRFGVMERLSPSGQIAPVSGETQEKKSLVDYVTDNTNDQSSNEMRASTQENNDTSSIEVGPSASITVAPESIETNEAPPVREFPATGAGALGFVTISMLCVGVGLRNIR